MQPFSFFFCWGGGISGRVRALNLTVPLGSGRVGSDNLGYGPGSGFSFEPVQTSSLSLMIRIKLTLTGKYIFILIYSLPNSYNHRNGINLITNIQEGEKRLLTHCSFARFLMNYFFFFDLWLVAPTLRCIIATYRVGVWTRVYPFHKNSSVLLR